MAMISPRPRFQALAAVVIRGATWALLALAALLLAAFVELTEELSNGRSAQNSGGLDADLLRWMAEFRRPWLNGVAIDLTALGSPLVVAPFTVAAAFLLLARRDRHGAALLLLSSLSSALMTALLKDLLERPRPEVVPRLVHVTSLSYPSGHSLASAAVYLTASLIVGRHLSSTAQRLACIGFTAAVVLLVGLSRVYFGIHYLSDVLGGILVGTAWALLMAASLRRLRRTAPFVQAVTPGGVS